MQHLQCRQTIASIGKHLQIAPSRVFVPSFKHLHRGYEQAREALELHSGRMPLFKDAEHITTITHPQETPHLESFGRRKGTPRRCCGRARLVIFHRDTRPSGHFGTSSDGIDTKEGLLSYSQNGRINVRAHQPHHYFSMLCKPEEMSLNVGQLKVFNHCVAGLQVRIQRLLWHCKTCFGNVPGFALLSDLGKVRPSPTVASTLRI